MQFIDLQKQYQLYKEEINEAIQRVLDHGRYLMGPEMVELEEKLAKYAGAGHCFTMASGTDALLATLMALDIGPGDEVITSPFTWISSVQVIRLLGADPVFVDIEEETYNLRVDQIEAAITPKTKAVMPISLFGQMPDFGEINRIAKKQGLSVIEDGAQSFGATQRGKKSCGVSTMATTSFYPAKPLGCYGDGGAVFTSDEKLALRLQAIRNHGAVERYQNICLGFNGRCDTLQAAILLVKFKHFEEEQKRRCEIATRYCEELQGVCEVPKVAEGNSSSWAVYTIRTEQRDALQEHLQAQGIPSAIYYPKCMHEQPSLKTGYQRGDFPCAERMADQVLSLPIHPWLEEEAQERVIAAIKTFASNCVTA